MQLLREKPKDSRRILRLVVYGKIMASHIHHSRIHRFSGNQAIHILQTSRLGKISDRHGSEILGIIFEHHSDLAFNGFRYGTVELGQVAENRAVVDELFQPCGTVLCRVVQVILDVIGAECCHARLGIGCVVGNGQGIGVKHPYGLVLAAHLNLVFASDDHNNSSCYSKSQDFFFFGG